MPCSGYLERVGLGMNSYGIIAGKF